MIEYKILFYSILEYILPIKRMTMNADIFYFFIFLQKTNEMKIEIWKKLRKSQMFLSAKLYSECMIKNILSTNCTIIINMCSLFSVCVANVWNSGASRVFFCCEAVFGNIDDSAIIRQNCEYYIFFAHVFFSTIL